ncbi:uncharacterized protein PV09_01574 [Verruconis gallopava]|uniref:S-adenosyl-L-methionine-dependent methyltransferase n=1 Tax=Verruconis gallopava TaxID=253628 RepID=A0A0D2ALI7_9PEZI|nr:uncharacterized protein PV09_01574 [Verruconis gallopava]KIW07628.1 hypothetical protein PV09_01574 [Verruconis gallopava]
MRDHELHSSKQPRKESSLETRPATSSSAPNEGDGYHSASASLYSGSTPRMHQPSVTSPPPQTISLPPIQGTMGAGHTFDDDFDAHTEADADSAYDSESLIGGDTVTLASYITDYKYENGRRYHSYRDGSYWGPNDEHGNEIQDLAHHMYLITLGGKLHLAPITEPHNILDVGTGTGIWAIDMADAYPSAQVIGTDLSPIQPDFIPPNCTFEIDDVTMEWTYPRDHFDFVHIREMFGSVPDWQYLFKQAYKHVKPGGWVEIVEHSVEPISDDGTVGPDHFYTLWGKTVIECGEKFGKSFRIWKDAKEYMEKAGFVDIVEVRYKWPMNGWPLDPKLKEIGRWNQLRLHDGVEGFMLRLLTMALNWSYERAQLFLAEMRRTLKDTSTHAYLPGTVVYGRKPLVSRT